jgi:carboxypeptidase C (cathepsin A)
MRLHLFATIITFASLFHSLAMADLADGSCSNAQSAQVASNHTATINGKQISYDVTTGFLEVTAADNTSKACIFYTSYVVNNGKTRPLTFAFNGGPGSASLWLHLGIMGPYRVDMGADGVTPPASGGALLIPNDFSPLDLTDIVLIDPVSTGFSHTENGAMNDKFFGVKNDYTSIGAFIQNYLNLNNRWTSPKYIMGESYGGIRGNLLTNYLQSSLAIAIDGLILISPAISYTTFFNSPDNLTPYWTNFPNFATTAWYHKKIAAQYQGLDLNSVYEQAKKFSFDRYRTALELGSLISNSDFTSVAQELSDFTGLSLQYVTNANLRVNSQSMFVDLLADSQQTLGRYDSRFTKKSLTRNNWEDPSADLVGFRYVAAINQYLRVDLNFHQVSPYAEFGKITEWNDSQEDGTDSMVQLAQAMSSNPKLNVMIASGYFDLACPMATVEYEISQMPLSALLRSRISHKRYVGGHMMYTNPQALAQLKSDLVTFFGGQQ